MKPQQVRKHGLDVLAWAKRFDATLAAIDASDGFDVRCNVETSHPVESWELPEANALTLANNGRYSPTPVATIRRVIAASQPGPDDVFIDLGAGKARVMLVASEFAFKQILGVEFSASICEHAQRNIDAFTSPTQVCRNLQMRCEDAVAFEIPAEASVFYFYEPFTRVIADRVLRNIEGSLARQPRRARLCFVGMRLQGIIANRPGWTAIEYVSSPDDVYYDAIVYANR